MTRTITPFLPLGPSGQAAMLPGFMSNIGEAYLDPSGRVPLYMRDVSLGEIQADPREKGDGLCLLVREMGRAGRWAFRFPSGPAPRARTIVISNVYIRGVVAP